MASITQDMRYRLSLIKYAEKFGVTKAAIQYKNNRQYIYRWKCRYDGSIESLRDRSRRPHHHPNQHTPEGIKLINDMRRRNTDAGLVVFWVKTHATWLYPLHSWLISFSAKTGNHGDKTGESKVHCQTL